MVIQTDEPTAGAGNGTAQMSVAPLSLRVLSPELSLAPRAINLAEPQQFQQQPSLTLSSVTPQTSSTASQGNPFNPNWRVTGGTPMSPVPGGTGEDLPSQTPDIPRSKSS
jgi:hypothetical protein